VRRLSSEYEKVIVTHTDLDGIVSASLVIRYLGGYDRLYFAQPHQLWAVLCKVPSRSRLFICDLGVNEPSLNRLINELRRILRSGGEVYWFDHHVWDDSWIKTISKLGVKLFLDRNTCAAGVVYNSLGIKDASTEELVKGTCSLDLWRFDHWLGNYLARVVGYRGGARWKEYLVNKLVNFNGELPNEFLGIVEEVVSKELKIITNSLRKAGVVEYGRIKLVYYYKGNEEHLTSYIANALLSRYEADVAVICRKGSISLRSKSFNVRELAKALGGGGHPRAAGAPLRISLITKLLAIMGIKGPLIRKCVKSVLSKLDLMSQY